MPYYPTVIRGLTSRQARHHHCRHVTSSSAAMLSAAVCAAVPVMTWMDEPTINCEEEEIKLDVQHKRQTTRCDSNITIPCRITNIRRSLLDLIASKASAMIGAQGSPLLFSFNQTYCEQQQQTQSVDDGDMLVESQQQQQQQQQQLKRDDEPLYYGLFPQRQLFQPKVPYPLWNYDWDDRLDPQVSTRELRKNGVTRHVILIRHGQYDETHRQDEARVLTPLGEKQAHLTGQRIAQLIQHIESSTHVSQDHQQQGKMVAIRVSNLTRAKQTASIIAQYVPSTVLQVEPDPDLNEGRPCHSIPCTDKPIHTPESIAAYYSNSSTSQQDRHHTNTATDDPVESEQRPASIQKLPLVHSSIIRQTDEGHERIERAFHRYFYRAQPPSSQSLIPLEQPSSLLEKADTTDATLLQSETTTHSPTIVRHEYEIIVCHANVIRYFVCRALQIPPEAWLRFCIFNCSLTYLTIRPTGGVSLRILGDIGHLDYDHTTFSMHHGYNW